MPVTMQMSFNMSVCDSYDILDMIYTTNRSEWINIFNKKKGLQGILPLKTI